MKSRRSRRRGQGDDEEERRRGIMTREDRSRRKENRRRCGGEVWRRRRRRGNLGDLAGPAHDVAALDRLELQVPRHPCRISFNFYIGISFLSRFIFVFSIVPCLAPCG